MIEARNMLTVDETAKYLSLTPETVRRLIRRGELRATKLGKVWRVSREVLRRVEGGESSARSRQAPAVSTPDQSASDNPLARALAMVQARDAATPDTKPRAMSAAEELNIMRDERLAELCHER
jgi:excisionase family DNA binding protein